MHERNTMKIPLYFDNPSDELKFNGFEKKFNSLLYLDGQKFMDGFPNFLKENYYNVKKNTKEKYFYPVFFSYQCIHHLNQYYFNIPKNVIKDVKNNSCKLLLMNIYEGYELSLYDDVLKDNLLKVYNLKFTDLILVTGNLLKESPKGIKNIYCNYWESIIEDYDDQKSQEILTNIFSNKLKDHKFICLQRKLKIERLMLYTELYDYKNDGILTMGAGIDDEVLSMEKKHFFNYKTFRKYQKKKLKSTLPCEYDVNLSVENPTHDLQIEKYLNSYLHVVPETYFRYLEDQMFFSEKIYKPIVFMQPFVLFSQPHSLQYLRELGFKTFHSNFINEDYDKLTDDRERFLSALKQVKRVISMSRHQLRQMTQQFADILVHNHNNLKFIYNDNNRGYVDLLKLIKHW